MSQSFNKLTPAEAERLAYLIEELAEVQQAACKILRHGFDSFNPDNRAAGTNRGQLEREISDVLGAVARMRDAGDIHRNILTSYTPNKGARYMHHQEG